MITKEHLGWFRCFCKELKLVYLCNFVQGQNSFFYNHLRISMHPSFLLLWSLSLFFFFCILRGGLSMEPSSCLSLYMCLHSVCVYAVFLSFSATCAVEQRKLTVTLLPFFFLCVISSQFLLSTDFYRRRNDDLNILFFNYFSLENNHFFLFSFFFHLSAYTLAFCAHSVRKI